MRHGVLSSSSAAFLVLALAFVSIMTQGRDALAQDQTLQAHDSHGARRRADIAGQGKANPMAMILSGAMMLDWLGEERSAPALKPVAAALRAAVSDVMVEGVTLPGDLGGRGSTLEVARAVGTAFHTRMR